MLGTCETKLNQHPRKTINNTPRLPVSTAALEGCFLWVVLAFACIFGLQSAKVVKLAFQNADLATWRNILWCAEAACTYLAESERPKQKIMVEECYFPGGQNGPTPWQYFAPHLEASSGHIWQKLNFHDFVFFYTKNASKYARTLVGQLIQSNCWPWQRFSTTQVISCPRPASKFSRCLGTPQAAKKKWIIHMSSCVICSAKFHALPNPSKWPNIRICVESLKYTKNTS